MHCQVHVQCDTSKGNHARINTLRWSGEPALPVPRSPVQRHRKFSEVLGTMSLNSSITTRPSLTPVFYFSHTHIRLEGRYICREIDESMHLQRNKWEWTQNLHYHKERHQERQLAEVLSFFLSLFYSLPPDPINNVYCLAGKYTCKNYFTYRSIQIFKSCIKDLFSKIQFKSDLMHEIMRYLIYYSNHF